jgi:catechol 2,3-dioxygenase-like lactoylglutathione lyase family enzyme
MFTLMTMLQFLYLPVPELEPALAFYRDTLGWSEGWREGDHTVALAMPGVQVQLMVDVDAERAGRPGPILVVDDTREWITARRHELTVWLEPIEIPGGWWAGFEDPYGNAVYVLDQSAANEA